MKKTTKRTYARPEMKVVKLRHRCHILAGSGEGTQANRSGYGAANVQNWGDEE